MTVARRSAVSRSAVTGALAMSLSLTAAGLSGGSAAHAASGGVWTRLTSGSGLSLSAEPGVVRVGARLLVAWPQSPDTSTTSLHTRLLGPTGLPTGPQTTALTWSSISSDPAAFLLGGVPTIAFGGLRSLDSTDPYNGPMSYVQAADATSVTSWSLGAGSLTQSRYAYGDYGIGAVDDGSGSPVVAVAAASTDHVTVHHGIDPAVPAAAPDTVTPGTGEAQGVSAARDQVSDIVYAAWYSGAAGASQGVHAGQIWPAIGTPQKGPLSSVLYSGDPASVNPGQNVAIAGRVGGGVWAAYASGYPSPHKLVLWHVGTSHTVTLTRPGSIQYVGVSAAPGGRLWVWWVEGGTVFATRTNPTQTAFGVVRAAPGPSGASPTRTAGDGTLGFLDVVVNATPSSVAALYSTRILEALTVRVTPASVTATKGGAVVVTVTDAGVAVPGASVRLGAVTKKTDSHGRASFVIANKAKKSTLVATVTAAGFVAGRAILRVR